MSLIEGVSDITATIDEHRDFYKNKSIIDEASPTQWKNDRGTIDLSNALFDLYAFFLKDVMQGELKLTYESTKKENLVAWEVTFDIREQQ